MNEVLAGLHVVLLVGCGHRAQLEMARSSLEEPHTQVELSRFHEERSAQQCQLVVVVTAAAEGDGILADWAADGGCGGGSRRGIQFAGTFPSREPSVSDGEARI